jgi:hypothetical protein
MVNKQNKTLKTVKFPLRNDSYAFEFDSMVDQRPVIAETWDPEVADFFMELYPSLLERGNSISDLQQRASIEALTKGSSISNVSEFLQMVSKLKVKKNKE